MKKQLPLLAAVLAGLPIFAQAAEAPAPDYTLTANVGFASDYRYRGISQTYKEPAIQGGFDFSHKSGVYLGTWASNVESGELAGSNMEWDFYGGYNWQVNSDLAVNVGGLYYYYPGKDKTAYGFDPNTFEIYVGGTWKWINLKYSYSTTKLFGVTDSSGSGYLEGNVTYPLPADISLNLHYGHQFVAGDIAPGTSNDDYSDWKIGASMPVMGFTVGLAYVDTDVKSSNVTWGYLTDYSLGSKSKDLTSGTAVLTVSKSF
jgi:uncharacterized protein (TIGR02001 family)